VLAISLRKFEQMVAAGNAPSHVVLGRLRRWRPNDVQAWIAALPNSGSARHAGHADQSLCQKGGSQAKSAAERAE